MGSGRHTGRAAGVDGPAPGGVLTPRPAPFSNGRPRSCTNPVGAVISVHEQPVPVKLIENGNEAYGRANEPPRPNRHGECVTATSTTGISTAVPADRM